MRWLAMVAAMALAGCVSGDGHGDPDRLWLNVVPSSDDPQIIEWSDLDDSSAAANLVEQGLQLADASAYGSSSRALNVTEIGLVQPWVSAHEDVHAVHPLPVHFNGHTYHIGLDGMG